MSSMLCLKGVWFESEAVSFEMLKSVRRREFVRRLELMADLCLTSTVCSGESSCCLLSRQSVQSSSPWLCETKSIGRPQDVQPETSLESESEGIIEKVGKWWSK